MIGWQYSRVYLNGEVWGYHRTLNGEGHDQVFDQERTIWWDYGKPPVKSHLEPLEPDEVPVGIRTTPMKHFISKWWKAGKVAVAT